NSNLFKVVEQTIDSKYSEHKENGTLSLICLGRKAVAHFGKRNYNIKAEFPNFFDDIRFSKATGIMSELINDFQAGEYDEVKVAYNEFKTVIAQNRIVESVLPIDPNSLVHEDETDAESKEYIFEPG